MYDRRSGCEVLDQSTEVVLVAKELKKSLFESTGLSLYLCLPVCVWVSVIESAKRAKIFNKSA